MPSPELSEELRRTLRLEDPMGGLDYETAGLLRVGGWNAARIYANRIAAQNATSAFIVADASARADGFGYPISTKKLQELLKRPASEKPSDFEKRTRTKLGVTKGGGVADASINGVLMFPRGDGNKEHGVRVWASKSLLQGPQQPALLEVKNP